jgi:intraflagellar transport protein 81
MNQQYGQDGGLFGSKTPARTFSKAPALNTTDIKQIVDGLNRPPFMCNLSLVEFDDKPPLELLELLNRLLGSLDAQHAGVDIQRETQDKTQERIVGYLKVLGYPSDFNPNFQRDVVHGEKRTAQHILHWLLTRLPELQRRAYTAKFLVPLEIPDEFLCDDEMVQTYETYKDLQAEFKATH